MTKSIKQYFASLRATIAEGSETERLISLISIVSVAVWLVWLVLSLLGLVSRPLVYSLGAYPAGTLMLYQPWGILSYALVHTTVLHLVSNMLLLYLFGGLLERYRGGRALPGLFALGALMGALVYSIAYQTLNALGSFVPPLPLLGASAGIYAIAGGLIVLFPELRVRLWLIGEARVAYVVGGIILLQLLFGWSNLGGIFAHTGGLLMGAIWALIIRREGFDIALWLREQIERLLSRRARPRTSSPRPEASEIDKLLDKIRRSGYSGLSEEERRLFFTWNEQLTKRKTEPKP